MEEVRGINSNKVLKQFVELEISGRMYPWV
jgi:hypothetical protein